MPSVQAPQQPTPPAPQPSPAPAPAPREDLSEHLSTLIDDVHRLAAAYGWSERDILALGPQRRAAYLELCAG